MNSRDRILAALHHREPDRVPYDLCGTTTTAITRHVYLGAMDYRGINPVIGTAGIDPIQQVVTPADEVLKQLHVDTRRIGARRIPGFSWEEAKDLKEIRVTDIYGCQWVYHAGKDLHFNQASFPLEPAETLSGAIDSLKLIDWGWYRQILEKDLDAQIHGTEEYFLIADRNTAGLTENSLRVRGYEKWYMDTVLDPHGVEALLERMTGDKIRYWDLVELIPDLVEAGMDILNPVQFTAKGMELKGLKKDFGDAVTFWGGGVDTQNTLNKGTPSEVSNEVKRILDIMAPGGGFVFTPVHNIQHDVSPENFWAMWDTLREYGKY